MTASVQHHMQYEASFGCQQDIDTPKVLARDMQVNLAAKAEKLETCHVSTVLGHTRVASSLLQN